MKRHHVIINNLYSTLLGYLFVYLFIYFPNYYFSKYILLILFDLYLKLNQLSYYHYHFSLFLHFSFSAFFRLNIYMHLICKERGIWWIDILPTNCVHCLLNPPRYQNYSRYTINPWKMSKSNAAKESISLEFYCFVNVAYYQSMAIIKIQLHSRWNNNEGDPVSHVRPLYIYNTVQTAASGDKIRTNTIEINVSSH